MQSLMALNNLNKCNNTVDKKCTHWKDKEESNWSISCGSCTQSMQHKAGLWFLIMFEL